MNLFRSKLFSRIYYFVILLLLIVSVGTTGFMLIEKWNFVDSFYMTIITVSTVGFREVAELSTEGKFFTAFLIISSFGSFAFAITSITTFVVGGQYRKHLREYKMTQQLKKMKDHVIICGYGRVGSQVASDLRSNGIEYVILEKDEHLISHQDDDTSFLYGDSTDDEILKRASIGTAKAIITCLPKDADNLYVVLSARQFNSEVLIVSRASAPSSVSKLKFAGADNVIMPDAVGGSHMASLIANADVMEFIDNIRVKGYMETNVESISYEELPAKLRNLTIGDLDSRTITGVTIVGFKSINGAYIINPDMDIKVDEGSKLFVLGNTKQIRKLVEHFELNRE
ncbi:MAG: potassium channel protein [Crocinitomicaceae bacterium]|nr:NAD-binding protein [Flavobacteriales bacterium]NQZ37218.1 potassium channel protein [Crocinitomicaceae bacterium]PHR32188.1 MAG: potassium channel protein [Fluviicola sp.]